MGVEENQNKDQYQNKGKDKEHHRELLYNGRIIDAAE